MPDRIPTFKPPWINRKPRAKRVTPETRPNAHQRGYCGAGWKATRRDVLLRDNSQCQSCGALVMGRAAHIDHIVTKAQGGSDLPSNLQTLCSSCHSRKTSKERVGNSASRRGASHPSWMPRSAIPVTVVCGPPASGKSTYVEEHKGDGDLVIDLDVIASRLAGTGLHSWGSKWVGEALRQRNEMLAFLHRQEAFKWKRAWVVVAEPEAAKRQWWVDKLGASRIVVVETPADTCEARMMVDEDRAMRAGNARQWWTAYTRRNGDEIVLGYATTLAGIT